MASDLDEPGAPGAEGGDLADPAANGAAASAVDGAVDGAAEPRAEVPALTRVRVLALATLGPLLTGYLAIAALLALVTATATDAHFATTGVLEAALPAWLAAHQVPVRFTGLELGVLPLLPTIGLAALTAKVAAGAAARLGLRRPGQAGKLIAMIAAAHGVAGVLVAEFSARGGVSADQLAALYYPALVAALAATAGVARTGGLLAAVVQRADEAAVAGLRAGAFAVVLLLTAGGALLTFGLLTSIDTARDLFPAGWGNAVGMLLLCVGYLPNAVVAATAFLGGPGFSIGPAAMAPMAFEGGPVPAVPLLAALPEREALWWPALFVLPLAVGVLVGRWLRDADEHPVVRLRAVAVAAGVVAVAFVLLAAGAGGRLGRGPFDPVDLRATALPIALVLWTAVPAAVAAWFGGPRPAQARMPGLLDDEPEPLVAEDEEPDTAEGAPPGEPGEATGKENEDEDGPATEVPGPRDAVEESGEVARD